MAIRVFTQDDFEELWRRALPSHYTEPIEQENDGAGFDIPAAQAAMFGEAERNMNLSQQAYFLKPHSIQTGPIARGGRKATGQVQLTRVQPALGDLLIPKGRRLLAEMTSSTGTTLLVGRYLLTQDETLPEGSGPPLNVQVEAEFQGYTGNLAFPGLIVRFEPQGRATVPVRFQTTTTALREVSPAESGKFDRFDETLVGRYARIVQSTDPLVSSLVSQLPRRIVGTFEGTDGFGNTVLGIEFTPAIEAADVGKIALFEIEELEDFGVELSQVSLIEGGVSNALEAIAADRRQGRIEGETDDQLAARLCDLADTVSPAAIERITDSILTPLGIPWRLKEISDINTLMGFVWDLHPWDFGQLGQLGLVGGTEFVGQGVVWLDRLRRFFLICVGRGNAGEFGMAYDTTSPPSHAPNAWDVGFYDGTPVQYNIAIARLWERINQARAAGVGFLIVVDPSL